MHVSKSRDYVQQNVHSKNADFQARIFSYSISTENNLLQKVSVQTKKKNDAATGNNLITSSL